MTEKELNKRYFDWICQLVCNKQYTGDLTYTKLLTELYNTDFFASISVYETNTQIAMTINGKVVLVKIPSNDTKVVYGDAFRIGDTLADWLARNVKDVKEL